MKTIAALSLIWIIAATGWLMNILVILSLSTPMLEYAALDILRIVGIFIAPLGAILGLFY